MEYQRKKESSPRTYLREPRHQPKKFKSFSLIFGAATLISVAALWFHFFQAEERHPVVEKEDTQFLEEAYLPKAAAKIRNRAPSSTALRQKRLN
jgi:hypothetical protein